jgi:hypothetical protein
MSTCARPCCIQKGLHSCSICLREAYCSADCQKGDRKAHKSICKILKKLLFQLQPYHEVTLVIKEVREAVSMKKKENTQVLDHLISYALYQFGEKLIVRGLLTVNTLIIGGLR